MYPTMQSPLAPVLPPAPGVDPRAAAYQIALRKQKMLQAGQPMAAPPVAMPAPVAPQKSQIPAQQVNPAHDAIAKSTAEAARIKAYYSALENQKMAAQKNNYSGMR